MNTPDNLQPYIVRLVMKVDAPKGEPDTAVGNFVDLLVANGLREWVFRVEDINTGDVLGYFDGYGDPVDVTAKPAEEPAEEPVNASETGETADGAPESDEALEALAESLNEQG